MRRVVLWVVLTMFPAAAFAQGVSGTISGTIRDAQGGVVPGATVMLTSQSRGTRSSPVVSNAQGGFVFANVPADTYTIRVELAGFRTLERPGVSVSPGAIVAVGALTIEVGGTAEVLTVTGEAPLVQSASGERSFTISTESVANLPIANRSYFGVLALAPGVIPQGGLNPLSRQGGGGGNNFMVDGATAIDPGINRPATRISAEAVAEVRLVTSTYQAEFGRSSGVQINAVTKSGTNQFRGSLYDVERNSRWNANSRTNILNGDPKVFEDERDWGVALGGPMGRPGGDNKFFFYFNLEMNPRTFGNNVNRYRVPTTLERMGDFSQSLDNNGNLYPYIKDPLAAGACSASNQAACFKDGGVLGRIPANRLYQAGLNILNWWPAPNIAQPGGQAYNFESVDPKVNLLGYQPILRLDYQFTSTMRASFRFLQYRQPSKVVQGTIPGWNDSKMDSYRIFVPGGSFNWTMTPTTFFEVNYGDNFRHQEGCSIAGGEPNYCRNALSVSQAANRFQAGFGDIPYLFPDAVLLSPDTWSYEVINRLDSTMWDGSRVVAPPGFTWGNRVANAPPDNRGPFRNFILNNRNYNFNATLTKVQGQHTVKSGFYYFRSYQRRGQGNITGTISFANDTSNPLDTSFGFSNAALGVFSTYSQLSRWGEGAYLAVNQEAFIQDNWRVSPRFTLDYGVRVVHQRPQYDSYGFSSNFLPDRWQAGAAPALYVAGCATGSSPCSTSNQRAVNPVTGEMLGPNTRLAIGTLVPGTGSTTNGVFAAGQGIVETNYQYPSLGVAPRVGAAFDVSGDQSFIVRGGAGLFFDRPPTQNIYNTVNNPPFSQNVTVRYGQLQNLASAGLRTESAPALTVWEYDQPLPSSVQWNGGVQAVLPFRTTIDVSYTGQHSYNEPRPRNLNSIDLGTAFLPENQNPARASSPASTESSTSYAATNPDIVRAFRGFGAINQQNPYGWRTYHSIQISLNRRFQNGLLFGYNHTVALSDRQNTTQRLDHNPDGSVVIRADQAQADDLLGNNRPQTHLMRGHFVWELPRLADRGAWQRAVGYVINDWSLSGIWSASSGTAYTVGYSYQSGGGNVNLTGSPDFPARVSVIGDPGSGCSSDPLRQFNVLAFEGPKTGSVGLESGNDYARGCFQSTTDLAVARTIRLGSNRSIQLRVDLFNAFNQAAITGRNTTINFVSQTNGTIRNLPFDDAGNLVESRSRPRGAGVGVATAYQAPRTVQMQARFSF